jgi:hypothetical protein
MLAPILKCTKIAGLTMRHGASKRRAGTLQRWPLMQSAVEFRSSSLLRKSGQAMTLRAVSESRRNGRRRALGIIALLVSKPPHDHLTPKSRLFYLESVVRDTGQLPSRTTDPRIAASRQHEREQVWRTWILTQKHF